MDIYYEKNVVNNKIDKKGKRTTVFQVCRIACIVLLFVAIFNVLSSRVIDTTGGTFALVMSIVMIVVLIALPAIGIWIFTSLINRLNSEYDYVISGQTFRIVRVLNRVQRKKFIELSTDSFAAVGLMDSESYLRLTSGQQIKTVNAYCDDVADLAYLYVNRDGERKMIIIEIDKQFVFNLKRVSNPTVFDDSINKYLSTKESK